MADGASLFPRLEFTVKAAGTLAVLVGAFLSVKGYTDARTKEAEARKFEATASFRKLRQDRYVEIVAVTAKLAAAKFETAAELAVAKKRFYEMFWGDLSLVESDGIKSAMEKLGAALNDNDQSGVQQWAYRVAHLARNGLFASEGVETAGLHLSKSPPDIDGWR